MTSPLPADEPAKNTATKAATDWPQFLGPQRTGISAETGLLTEWPVDGPKELWRVNGGGGMSAVVVSDGLAITLVQNAGQIVLALDAATGDVKWQTEVAPAYKNSMGDGPRGTPVIHGQTVVVLTGEGVLAALNKADGKLLWSGNLVKQFGGKPAEYGQACSPLVYDGKAIVTLGAPQALVAAVDIKSGKVAWTAGKNQSAGYSSPAVLTIKGQPQLVVFGGDGALAVNPADGTVLWQYPYITDYKCNIATPVAIGDNVLLSAGENHGSVVLQTTDAAGKLLPRPKVVWESQGGGSVLRNEWQTSLLLGGNLYGFDNVGSAGPVTHLTCVDATTGEPRWQEKRFGKGNMISADGKLFISTFAGELAIAKVNADRYEELGRKKVFGRTRTAPALANGRLFLRDDRQIVCFDVTAP